MSLDFNNIDLVAMSTKAAAAVEELMQNEPYVNYSDAERESTRTSLTAHFTQMLLADFREQSKKKENLPPPPPQTFDPAVAAILGQ